MFIRRKTNKTKHQLKKTKGKNLVLFLLHNFIQPHILINDHAQVSSPAWVLSPGKRITESKLLFDSAFRKETWVINPTIILFLTPIEVKDAKQNQDGTVLQGLLPLIAPVNHNKLNPAKMYQILHTIIGNPYQDHNETAQANEDFGNDASIIVGFHDMTMRKESGPNRAYMHCLHPEDDHSREMLYHTLFPPDDESFNSVITSSEFKQLLKTDATTKTGCNILLTTLGWEIRQIGWKERTPWNNISNCCARSKK